MIPNATREYVRIPISVLYLNYLYLIFLIEERYSIDNKIIKPPITFKRKLSSKIKYASIITIGL